MSSFVNTIQTFAPGYNPFYVVLSSSTASTLAGYEYIVDIYKHNSNVLERRFFVQPLQNENYWGKIDISRTLSNIAFTGNPIANGTSGITVNTVQSQAFDIKIGEQYYYYWNFTDNYYNAITTAYTGYLGFTAASATHSFVVGDYVTIAQDAGYAEENYNGTFQVVYVPDNKSIVVNFPFTTSTPANPGTARYSDYRKKVTTGQTTSSTTIYDGSEDNFYSYAWLSATTYPTTPLTILPTYTSASTIAGTNAYKVRIAQEGFFNIYCGEAVKDIIVTKNDGTTLDILPVGLIPYSNFPCMLKFPFAPESINQWLGYDWISGDTSYYKIDLISTGGTNNIMDNYYIDVDLSCDRFKSDIILFEDLRGSFIPVSVYPTKENVSVTKTFYKEKPDMYIDGGNYIRKDYEQWEKIYDINYNEVYTVNTGYIKEGMVDVIENLVLYAKNVYINKDGEGIYRPITIITSDFQRKKDKYKTDRLKEYTFTYRFSQGKSFNI